MDKFGNCLYTAQGDFVCEAMNGEKKVFGGNGTEGSIEHFTGATVCSTDHILKRAAFELAKSRNQNDRTGLVNAAINDQCKVVYPTLTSVYADPTTRASLVRSLQSSAQKIVDANLNKLRGNCNTVYTDKTIWDSPVYTQALGQFESANPEYKNFNTYLQNAGKNICVNPTPAAPATRSRSR